MSSLERAAAVIAIALWGISAALVAELSFGSSYAALMFGVAVPGLTIAMYGVKTHAQPQARTGSQPAIEDAR